MPTIYTNINNLPERRENDFYPTPIELCRDALRILLNHDEYFEPLEVLDPGAGDGIWGKAFREVYQNKFILLHGIEIRDTPACAEYDLWTNNDYLKLVNYSDGFPNLIIGNPPYKFVNEFLDKSFSLLEEGGYILFLLRLSFLESQKRYKKYFSKGLNPKEVHVSVRRVSFTGNRKSSADAYGVFLWQKGYIGDTTLKWLNWSYDDQNRRCC